MSCQAKENSCFLTQILLAYYPKHLSRVIFTQLWGHTIIFISLFQQKKWKRLRSCLPQDHTTVQLSSQDWNSGKELAQMELVAMQIVHSLIFLASWKGNHLVLVILTLWMDEEKRKATQQKFQSGFSSSNLEQLFWTAEFSELNTESKRHKGILLAVWTPPKNQY